jgi:acyl carrier protein
MDEVDASVGNAFQTNCAATNAIGIPQELKQYVDNNRGSLPPVADPNQPLQIDSLGLIRLVAFLESDLGIRVEDEELIAENFATLRKLGELLATKTPSGRTAKLKRPFRKVFLQFRRGAKSNRLETAHGGRPAAAPDGCRASNDAVTAERATRDADWSAASGGRL